MRKATINLLFIICLALNYSVVSAQNPYIQQFTTADGLPSNLVYQVYQDSQHFIWFATDAGVARFDGSHFNYFRKKDGLNSNEVIRIKEDTQGRIWFFHLNGSFNFYYKNNVYNAANAPYLDSLRSTNFFRDFFEDDDKTIYFYNNLNLEIYTLDKQTNVKKFKLTSKPLQRADRQSMAQGMLDSYFSNDPEKAFLIWFASGIYSLKDFEEPMHLLDDRFIIDRVFTSYPDTDSIIYADVYCPQTNMRRVARYKHHIFQDTINTPRRENEELFAAIYDDRTGNTWFSSFYTGVYMMRDGELKRYFNIRKSQAVMQDHENNIWISSMSEGVNKISPGFEFHKQFDPPLFGGKGVQAMTKNRDGGIWCTNGSSLFLLKNDKIYKSEFDVAEASFDQIFQLQNNKLLLGESNSRIYIIKDPQLDEQKNMVNHSGVEILDMFAKRISVNQASDMAYTYWPHQIFVMNQDKMFEEIEIFYKVPERIYATFVNIHDELYLNGQRIYKFSEGQFIQDEKYKFLNDRRITGHLILNNAELFNIDGDSLYLFRDEKLVNLSESFNYPIEQQIKHVEYNDALLFVATSSNIYYCADPLLAFENEAVQLLPLDLSFRSINDILYNEEVLYVGSDDGLAVIPLLSFGKLESHVPQPYFQSILLNDTHRLDSEQKLFVSGNNKLHLSFGNINYSGSLVSYSYMLEGADNDWRTGSETSVVYQNLSKGDYVFRLRVRKPTTNWSNEITFALTVKPTVWQHPLFIALTVLLILAAFYQLLLRRKNAEIQRRQTEHQLILLEQKALQSMMNPHFIFNALGSIQNYLLQNKPIDAGNYLSQFARLIRLNINAINSTLVLLDEEIERLRNYLDLEKLRLADRFTYEIMLDDAIDEDEIMIPAMIIQPIVENAVWHGMGSIEDNGEIRISFFLHTHNSIKIIVEDNGIGITESARHSKRGTNHLHLSMAATHKRLEIIGKKMQVETFIHTTEANPDAVQPGTRVELVVPFSTEKLNF